MKLVDCFINQEKSCHWVNRILNLFAKAGFTTKLCLATLSKQVSTYKLECWSVQSRQVTHQWWLAI